ncbi:hypothetical protein [Roseimaritima sediminicola]|uniref:hypothetical protein n=1 Tax=Roseimaritima sediminicola TaxID=2662066 RepID=UPI001298309F|nr:hypothetical protein [Roseimaritima sediminicola]
MPQQTPVPADWRDPAHFVAEASKALEAITSDIGDHYKTDAKLLEIGTAADAVWFALRSEKLDIVTAHTRARHLLDICEGVSGLYCTAAAYAVECLARAWAAEALMVDREPRKPANAPAASKYGTAEVTADSDDDAVIFVPAVLIAGHGFTAWSERAMSEAEAEALRETLAYDHFDLQIVEVQVRLPNALRVVSDIQYHDGIAADPVQVTVRGPACPFAKSVTEVAAD